MVELWIIGILIVLNVAQAAFWMRQTQKLVDKLMSRNYADYSQSVSYQSRPPTKATSLSNLADDESEPDFRTLEGIGL
jgi:hypothetical protein